ncbi:type II toxin-antitoxin system RelE/ParE family toxin [Sphingomonas sp. LT1P40]|uniref:type II toxin-antitoxin system RelE/ParE family toxin n=1 Tax=Alteristakelama amylovorans TaxID=3096166 RepID=UPI003FA6C2B8
MEIPLRLDISRRAERDLTGIWLYSAREWGVDQADSYYEKLVASITLLREHPDFGSWRLIRGRPCRRWVIGSHAIVFQVRGRSLHIIRILHAAMDERRHLG